MIASGFLLIIKRLFKLLIIRPNFSTKIRLSIRFGFSSRTSSTLIAPTFLLILMQPLQLTADTATIAVASNFKPTLALLVAKFETQSEHRLRVVSTSTGVLFNQIKHGAPFDLLLAADNTHPMLLEQQGLGVKGSRFTYATGGLALVFNDNSQQLFGKASIDENFIVDIINQSKGKIAIANPKLAPYGLATQRVLSKLGLWETLQPRLVLGSNIAQSFQFVATANATVGFIALTQAINSKVQLNYWAIPDKWHLPIRQQAILLQSGNENRAAVEFVTFLKTSAAKAIINHNGYK